MTVPSVRDELKESISDSGPLLRKFLQNYLENMASPGLRGYLDDVYENLPTFEWLQYRATLGSLVGTTFKKAFPRFDKAKKAGSVAQTHFAVYKDADGDEQAARLALGAVKPALVHGDRGRYLSPVPDQTLLSIHLSWPRHVSGGWIEVDGTRYEVVTGTSWVDHQTLHLSKLMDVMEVGDKLNGLAKLKDTAVNWTWLTCNLDDGADLMLFALWDSKRDSGRVFMAGTYSAPDGKQVNLSQDDFEVTPLETSSSRGVKEPKAWRLRARVPGHGTYELNKAFHLDDNWVNINGAAVVEGATRVSGTMFADGKSKPVNAVAAWGETVNFLGRQPE